MAPSHTAKNHHTWDLYPGPSRISRLTLEAASFNRDASEMVRQGANKVLTAVHEGVFAMHEAERTGGGYGSCKGPKALTSSSGRENFCLLMCLLQGGVWPGEAS